MNQQSTYEIFEGVKEMLKKMNVKLYTNIILAVLIFAFVASANEVDNNLSQKDENIVTPFFIAITDCANGFSQNSNGSFYCYGDTFVQSGYTAKVVTELQRLVNGQWTTINTWSDSDTFYAVTSNNYYVVSGYYYRLKTTHQAISNGSVIETVVKYSSSIYY